MRKVLAALAASFALISAASAVEFNHIEGYPTAVQMHGDVEAGDGAKFQQVLDYRASKGLWTEWLTVDSYGGNTYAGWELAELVRTNSIKVVVNGGSHCLSACFKIFAAAHAGRSSIPKRRLACIPRQRPTSTAMISAATRRARCARRWQRRSI